MFRDTFLILVLLASCRPIERKQIDKVKVIDSSTLNLKGYEDQVSFFTSNMSVHDFLKAVKIDDSSDFNVITMEKEFTKDWIKEAEIDTLMTLITSREKCKCILNPMSSHIPIGDSADLGGYTIEILKAYRQNRSFQFKLWACPKTNEKEVNELTTWNKASKSSRFR